MGLDLTLFFLRRPGELGETFVLCRDRLSFDTDYNIFCQIIELREYNKPTIRANHIPPQMWVETYEETGIERRRNDNQGDDLTFV